MKILTMLLYFARLSRGKSSGEFTWRLWQNTVDILDNHMKVSVYGAGYVGLVSAACLAKLGHEVICVDIDADRIDRLNAGDCPIYEAQLPELLNTQRACGRLLFTASLTQAIQYASLHIIATGTPSLPDGHADLSQVYSVAKQIIQQATQAALLVTKSTVPVGTGDALEQYLQSIVHEINPGIQFEIASNPEFLREGSAVSDFLKADRVVLGGREQALSHLKALYEPLSMAGVPLVCMSRTSAELTKYASNAMLACRVSFMNQISRIAEKTGANIDEIQQGIGLDPRIGPHFLRAGIGYGGSCFPKDTRALISSAKSLGVDASLFEAIEQINHDQKHWVIEQLQTHFKDQLAGLTVGIWGLSFKPGTDDLREASSLSLIDALQAARANLRLYDPAGLKRAQSCLTDHASITWCFSAESVCSEPIDALVIATEWQEFKAFPLPRLAQLLGSAPIFDGRNCYALHEVKRAGFSGYYSVGRPFISKS